MLSEKDGCTTVCKIIYIFEEKVLFSLFFSTSLPYKSFTVNICSYYNQGKLLNYSIRNTFNSLIFPCLSLDDDCRILTPTIPH